MCAQTSWETDCRKYVWDGVSEKSTVRTIYLATDDPITIKKEISKLPMGQGGTTIVGGEWCHRVGSSIICVSSVRIFSMFFRM